MSDLLAHRKNLGQLVSVVRRLLGDFDGERYSKARIIEALNDAAMELSMRTQLVQDTVHIVLRDQQSLYSIVDAVDADSTKRGYGYLIRVGCNGQEYPGLLPVGTATLDFSGIILSET